MESKICSGCKKLLPIDSFGVRKDRSKKAFGEPRPLSQCKQCTKNMHAEWRGRNKASRKKSAITYMYGIPFEEYESMLKSQEGKCKICGETSKLYIDHDHTTGKVRGLICQLCNSGLGMFRDNKQILQSAINYLQ